MREEKSVYKALFSEQEVELESRKVELGIIDDINASIRENISRSSNAGGFILKAKQVLIKAESNIQKELKEIAKAKKMAKELGVDIKPLNNLEDKANDFISRISKGIKSLNDVEI